MIPQDYEDGYIQPQRNSDITDRSPRLDFDPVAEFTTPEIISSGTEGGTEGGGYGRQQCMFTSKAASEWLSDAARRPNPVQLWYSLWYEGEVCCLFADTNVGKSIYAVQIADRISRSQKVLYFDFEMSDKQFQLRYTDPATGEMYPFSRDFIRLEFNPGYTGTFALEDIISHMERQVESTGARVLIVDNLSWICNRAESGDAAGELMQLLIGLKRRHGLSILVLAHTPKRNVAAPLTQNSLAGSKRIANFMDSMFAIGVSRIDSPAGRYIKQIKVRNSELFYGDDNVITGRMCRQGQNLVLQHEDFATELSQLENPDGADATDTDERDEEIRRRLRQGETYSNISAEMRVSSKTIAQIARTMRDD